MTWNSNASIKKLWRQAQTLKEMISVYAPAEDWNNPNSYANAVASALWVSPDEPLSNLTWRVNEVAKAMAKHEGYTWTINLWTWKNQMKKI